MKREEFRDWSELWQWAVDRKALQSQGKIFYCYGDGSYREEVDGDYKLDFGDSLHEYKKLIKLESEFEKLAKPLIKFLNDNYHPHAHIVITTNSAEVSEGSEVFSTNEFIKD